VKDKVELHARLVRVIIHLRDNRDITKSFNKVMREVLYTGSAAYRVFYNKVDNKIKVESVNIKEIYE